MRCGARRSTARPIAPITEGRPYLAVEDAYAIQTVNIERRVIAGALVRGRKVGLTSEPMQRLLGVNEPDFGALLDDMFVEDGDEIGARDDAPAQSGGRDGLRHGA